MKSYYVSCFFIIHIGKASAKALAFPIIRFQSRLHDESSTVQQASPDYLL